MGGCSRAGPQLECRVRDLYTEPPTEACDAPTATGVPAQGLSPYCAELEGVRAWVLGRPTGEVRCCCCCRCLQRTGLIHCLIKRCPPPQVHLLDTAARFGLLPLGVLERFFACERVQLCPSVRGAEPPAPSSMPLPHPSSSPPGLVREGVLAAGEEEDAYRLARTAAGAQRGGSERAPACDVTTAMGNLAMVRAGVGKRVCAGQLIAAARLPHTFIDLLCVP